MSNDVKKEKKEIRKGPKVLGRIILLTVILVGGFLGYRKIHDDMNYCSSEDASIKAESVNISSRMLGRIKEILVEEGQQVNAGDVLILLDATDLEAQKVQAMASLNYTRKNLELSEVSLNRAQSDFNRVENLTKLGATTRENYDHAVSALNTAKAQYNLVQAQIETSEAQLGILEAQLQNTVIKAPISGRIFNLSFSEGDVIQPSQKILTLNNLENLWIIANIKETEIHRIEIGAEVHIHVDAFAGEDLTGNVSVIHSGIVAPAFQIGEFTKTTQRIPVRIDLNDPQDRSDALPLIPGMSVEVKIKTPVEGLFIR